MAEPSSQKVHQIQISKKRHLAEVNYEYVQRDNTAIWQDEIVWADETIPRQSTFDGQNNGASSNSSIQLFDGSDSCAQDAMLLNDPQQFRQKFCMHISYLFLRTDAIDECQHYFLKIPVVEQYYEGVFERVMMDRICHFLDDVGFFNMMFTRVYESAYKHQIPRQLSLMIHEKSVKCTDGYQRVPLLFSYLPERSKVRTVLAKKFQIYIQETISDPLFIDRVVDQYHNHDDGSDDEGNAKSIEDDDERFEPTTLPTLGKQDPDDFVDAFYKILETVHLNAIKPSKISSKLFTKKLLAEVNYQLEQKSEKVSIKKLIRILYCCAKYNAVSFWEVVEKNSQCIESVLMKGLSLFYDKDVSRTSLEDRSDAMILRDEVLQFLYEILEAKGARTMVVRMCEFIFDIKLGTVELEFLIKISVKNSLLGESVLPKILKKIEELTSSKKIKSKVFLVGIVSLLQNLIQAKYKLTLKQFIRILSPIKCNHETVRGAMYGLKSYLKQKMEEADDQIIYNYYSTFFSTFSHYLEKNC